MRLQRILLALFVFVVGAALAACVSVPKQEVQSYADAFQQANLAGDALLDKISPIIAEIEIRHNLAVPNTDCAKDKRGMPACFNLAAVRNSGQPTDPPSILVRRVALKLISEYNGALVDLATGKSADAVQSRIGEVAKLARGALALVSVNPVLAAALPGLASQFGALAARFEQLRANGLVRQAVADGRAPVQKLLAALAADAPDLYELYHRRRLDDYADATIAGGTQAIVADVNNFYDSVAAYVQLLDKTSSTLDVLAEAAARGGTPSIENIQAAIQAATEIKGQAQTFWSAIRKVRGIGGG
jgi:hypothetical protein